MLSPSVVVFNCCCHKRSLSDVCTICDAQVIVYINNNHCHITNVSNKVSTNQNINSYCNKISMCNTSRKYSQDSCQVHSTKLSSRPLNKLKMKYIIQRYLTYWATKPGHPFHSISYKKHISCYIFLCIQLLLFFSFGL